MSRYAFVAAATLFAGLLFVLAMAVAQRDARVNHSVSHEEEPDYAKQSVAPISVAKTAIGSGEQREASQESFPELPPLHLTNTQQPGRNRSYESEASSTVLATYNGPAVPLAFDGPTNAAEPPRFDASRIISRRSNETDATPIAQGRSSDLDSPTSTSNPKPLAKTGVKPGVKPSIKPISTADTRVAPPVLPSTNSNPDTSNLVGLAAPSVLSPTQSAPGGTANSTPGAYMPTNSPNDRELELNESSRARPAATLGSPLPVPSNGTAPVPESGASSATLPPAAFPYLDTVSPPSLPSSAATLPSLPVAPSVTAPNNGFPSSSLPDLTSLASPANGGVSAPSAKRDASTNATNVPTQGPLPFGAAPTSNDFPPTNSPTTSLSSPNFPPANPNAVSSGYPSTSDSRRNGGWSLSSGAPGARQFDGSQNPSLEIHKKAPAEVQVGVPATFHAVVRNVGNSTAFDVQVIDAIPKGAKLVRTSPEAERTGADGLQWNLGELTAGQEASISMELVPETEGELGSVASVKFAAQASVRTMSTQPRLSVKQTAPSELLGGGAVTVLIDVANVGTGTAKGVKLEEDVPNLFRHATGATKLGMPVGDLAPGESLRFEIELTALEAGKASNMIRATSENAATSESSLPIEVKAPKLQLQLVGPRIRYLERPAPYEAVIENVGTAVCRDLYIVTRLPRGMNFISANNEGTYIPDQHAVAWNLAELAAGTKVKTELTLLPVEEGRFSLLLTTEGEGVRASPTEREVQVEGQSELTFNIDDDNDPIETEGITTYTVQVTNIGTRPDTDVQLMVELPDGTALEQISSPLKYQTNGRSIAFAPLASLPSKDQLTVKISVRHAREGTQVLRASIRSKLRAVPVIKEESTQVYVDR